MLLGAANHDPRRFADPEQVDFSRTNIDHVSFGGGRHLCLGLFLARLELQYAYARMAQDWSEVTLNERSFERRANAQFPSIERMQLGVQRADSQPGRT